MSWDFCTEPEFEAKLDWAREFVREEIWPIETVFEELDQDQLDRFYAPLQKQVKAQRPWPARLPPELGGQGYGQVKLGLLHEILDTSPFAPNCVRLPGARQRQQRDPRTRTPEQKHRWLEAAGRRGEVLLLDDQARHR